MMNATIQGPDAIFQMMQAMNVTAVVQSAIELGVFPAIAGGATDCESIAKKIACPTRSTALLVEAVASLGLLNKKGTKFELPPVVEQFVVPGKPQYLGDVTSLFGSQMLWTTMANLKDAVRAGGTVMPEHAETPRHPFWEIFARSTVGMSVPSAMAIQSHIGPWLKTRTNPTMIDIAAGSGVYSYILTKENPTLSAKLLDWPNVLVETKRNAAKFGIDEKRVGYIEGNLFETDYQGQYDVVLLSHVFHHFEPSVCAKLMAKSVAAVKPGGKLVIQEFVTDNDHPAGRMFSMCMLGWTKGGQAYGSSDYKTWCEQAGLKNFVVHPGQGMPTSILIADKA
jgi:ubiquinone/menaquinone biosynthesis C-methylase UbiE